MNDDKKEDINKSENNKVETDNQSEVDQNDTTKDVIRLLRPKVQKFNLLLIIAK